MAGPGEWVQSSFSDFRSLAISSLTGRGSGEIRISGLTPKPPPKPPLGDIQTVLDGLISAGEKCEELHASMGLLERFKNAIDEVNDAHCGRQLAAGFDHLMTTAGEVGKRFVKIPELKPLFEILAYNETFFWDVSSKLDPEQRWASQFSQIDGYSMSNCQN